MRRVVFDPELLAAGVLGAPRPRRLLGLLAYGRWAQYAPLLGPAEEALLEQEAGRTGGVRGGPSSVDLQARARDRTALLKERLPYNAPDDLVLLTSTRIHEAVVDRVQIARMEHPGARAETGLGDKARRIVASLSPGIVGEIGSVPSEAVSIRDHLINVAAISSAPIVTDDEVLAPHEDAMFEHTDSLTGRPAYAVRSWTFIDAQIDCAPFALNDMPYEILELALRDVT